MVPSQTSPGTNDTNNRVDCAPVDHGDVEHTASSDEDESSYSASDELDSDDYDEETQIISTGKVIHFTHSGLTQVFKTLLSSPLAVSET